MPGDSNTTDGGEETRYIAAARSGDLSAFNWLVLRYQTRIYNLCYRMLSDPDAAADATQDAFLSAYKAISTFKGGQFRAWLMRIASNACLDMLRSRKRHRTQSIERGGTPETGGDDEEPLQIADDDLYADPEARVLNVEVAALIQQGLDSLPEDQRISLILVDVQGLSYEEAASITETNLGTIKSRINRGRSRMRHYLREAGLVAAAPGEQSARARRFSSED